MSILILLVILGVPAIIFIASYNRTIRYKNQTENAFGSIDAMLKKRYDLIPNLVEVVKQYAEHESQTLTEVTKLRAQLYENKSSSEKIEIHNDISKKMGNMLVNFENYPDLKANLNFLRLQSNWTETEEQISASRRFYNAAVTDYNNSIETFPSNIIASFFNFEHKKVLEIEEIERKNINARELFNK